MVVCLLSSQISWSQEASPTCARGALGYFDYSTGAFRPISQMGEFDSESVAAANPQTGTLIINLTITIKSAIPAASPISCNISATVMDISSAGANVIMETASVNGTRTGNTAKCTVKIPYSWTVFNLASATMDLSYSVSGGKAGGLMRSSSGGIASIPVPADGSTTTQTVNAVL